MSQYFDPKRHHCGSSRTIKDGLSIYTAAVLDKILPYLILTDHITMMLQLDVALQVVASLVLLQAECAYELPLFLATLVRQMAPQRRNVLVGLDVAVWTLEVQIVVVHGRGPIEIVQGVEVQFVLEKFLGVFGAFHGVPDRNELAPRRVIGREIFVRVLQEVVWKHRVEHWHIIRSIEQDTNDSNGKCVVCTQTSN